MTHIDKTSWLVRAKNFRRRILYDKEGRKSQEISPRLYDSTKDHLEQHSYDVQNVGTRYTYYDSGLVHTVTDAENNTITYTYDVYGNMLTKTLPNPNGKSTGPQPVYTYKYDEMNRLTNESWQDSVDATTITPLENYKYEIVDGQTINGVTPKNQKKTTTKYLNNTDTAQFATVSDYAGRTIKRWDPAKPLLTEYYGNGELKSVTDKNGNKTYYYPDKYDSSTNTRYDEVYAPVDKDANGNIRYAYTRIDYDGEHRKHIETAAVDKVALNSVTTATIPQNSIVTTYDYYESGKLKSVRDNSGKRTDYSYDNDGNLMTQDVYTSSTSSNRTSYINNYLGKPSQKTVSIRKGDLADFTYDTNDSFDIITYYDYYTDGLLKNAKVLNTPTTSITIEYGYDNMGRQISMSQPYNDECGVTTTAAITTKYNYEGKPLIQTDAKLNVTSYEYNQMGLPVKVKKATVTGGMSDIITQYDYDRAGRKIYEVSPANYNYTNEIPCKDNPNRTEYYYDAMDRLKTQKEVFKEKKIIAGTTGTYSIDDSQTTTITTKAYQYDNNGNVIKELDALGFESASGTEDDKIANGYGKVYTYNCANKIESVVDAEGKYSNGLKYATKYEYDALGRQITQTAVKGTAANTFYVSTMNTYDDKNNTKTVSFKKASTEVGLASTAANKLGVSTYDNAGNLTKQTNYRNATTSSAAVYIYNALGKVSQAANPLDSDTTVKTTSQYDVMGNLIKQVNDMGTSSVTTDDIIDLYAYNDQGRQLLHKKQRGDGTEAVTVSAIKIDLNGNKRFETDGNGYQKENTYDGLNRLVDTIEGNIHSEDDAGILITHTATNSYDKNNNLLTKTLQITSTKNSVTSTLANTLSSNLYDPINRLYEKKDANNNDAVIQMLDYNHNSLQATSYDVSTASAVFVTTTFTYDKDGRLLSTTDPKNHTSSQTYDYAGNIASKTDGRGNANSATKADHTTNYSYNEFDKLAKVTKANHENTIYDYDWCGNMTGQTDGKTNKTIFEYNAANLLVKKVYPNGRPANTTGANDDPKKTETYTYYGNGSIKTKTDRNRNTFAGWMNSVTSGAIQIVKYKYDDNGNQLGMTDASGSTTRTYDELNRVRSKSVIINNPTDPNNPTNMGKGKYSYDIIMADGCTAEKDTYVKPSETFDNKTIKAYDPEGRLKYVKDIKIDDTTIPVATYNYYANSSTQSVIYGDPQTTTPDASEEYTYYEDGTLNTLTNKKSGTAFETYTYTYDEAHNITSKIDPKGTTQYNYDNLNRLQTVTQQAINLVTTVTSYEYDQAGNRLKQTSGNKIINYEYDDQNRLQVVTTSAISVTNVDKFIYDDNGNQLTITNTPYANNSPQTGSATITQNGYDLLNQLICTTIGAITVSNAYNGEGLRVSKSVKNGSTTTSTMYLYEYGKVVLETNELGYDTARNIYGTNLLKRTIMATPLAPVGVPQQSMYYMYNGHADVTALIDASNKSTVGTYYYDAFGNLDTTGGTTGTPNNSITYAGYQYDKDTGLYYCNARMYDPKIARFLQEDTVTGDPNDPLSLNLYTYCHNEPLMYDDPTGNTWSRQYNGSTLEWLWHDDVRYDGSELRTFTKTSEDQMAGDLLNNLENGRRGEYSKTYYHDIKTYGQATVAGNNPLDEYNFDMSADEQTLNFKYVQNASKLIRESNLGKSLRIDHDFSGVGFDDYINIMGPLWEFNTKYRTIDDNIRDAKMGAAIIIAIGAPYVLPEMASAATTAAYTSGGTFVLNNAEPIIYGSAGAVGGGYATIKDIQDKNYSQIPLDLLTAVAGAYTLKSTASNYNQYVGLNTNKLVVDDTEGTSSLANGRTYPERQLLNGSEWEDYLKQAYGSENVEWITKNKSSFGSRDLLEEHFDNHGNEFYRIYTNADEYLQGAKDVMNNGYKVQYDYKVTDKWGMKVPEKRTGYIRFMGNSRKGEAKFEFVGTNNRGDITTYHTESGKTLWKLLNGLFYWINSFISIRGGDLLKYLVNIEGFNSLIEEEEVIVNIDGQQIRCFMPFGRGIEIVVGNQYYANIEVEVFDSLELEEIPGCLKEMKCINQTFAYYVMGKMNIDSGKIESSIDIYLDEEDLHNYGHCDNKYVKLKVDRLNIEFDE